MPKRNDFAAFFHELERRGLRQRVIDKNELSERLELHDIPMGQRKKAIHRLKRLDLEITDLKKTLRIG